MIVFDYWCRKRSKFFLFVIVSSMLLYVCVNNYLKFPLLQLKSQNKGEMVCRLPKLKPFDPSIIQFFKKLETNFSCNNTRYPLIFKTDIDNNLIAVENPQKFGFKDCCYKYFYWETEFTYTESDDCTQLNISIGESIKIPKNFEFEFIGIQCYLMDGTVKIIDGFSFTNLKQTVEDRIHKKKLKTSNDLSIVMLGFDAVSHMNFIRNMPKTYNYLTNELFGIGMNGYTKVGENTFPNISPVLVGLHINEMNETCWNSRRDTFDHCPFIWKNFSAQGYRTSFGEDDPGLGIFTLGEHGFYKQPTDYYLRPFSIYQCKNIKNGPCYGPRLSIEYFLDNIKKMAWTMNKNEIRKYFQFIMTSHLSHSSLNNLQFADNMVFSTLNFFKINGFLNNTIFILMSDHGYRAGEIRRTFQGTIEDSMPLLYFILPEWFKQKYTHAVNNLKWNIDKLTSHFDLHETLMDLINLNDKIYDDNIILRQNNLQNDEMMNQLPRGISLFLSIPINRTCPMAGIPTLHCVCQSFIKISISETEVIEAANHFILFLNNKLKPYEQCSILKLYKILNAKKYTINSSRFDVIEERQSNIDHTKKKIYELILTLKTIPGNGIFETTLSRTKNEMWIDKYDHSPTKNETWIVSSDSRINLYGNQSYCVSRYLKKYCFCKDYK